MLNPQYIKYKTLFELNDLAFKTKYDIINSNHIQKILPPYPSFLDRRNIKGAENYSRYCNQANYISFPNICLDAVIGITNKKQPEVIVPKNMESLIDYATVDGTSLLQIQNEIVESLFKFGLAGILVELPENVSIATSIPKLRVYSGDKIIDYQQALDENGNRKFTFLTLDGSRYVYSKEQKNYSFTKIYKILSITNEGRYCVAEVLASAYSTYNPENPEFTSGVLSIEYPSWTDELNFIPFVPISNLNTTIKYGPSFIQDLINVSLQNFRLEANLCWLEANAAASHLVIKGRNLEDASQYPIGAGAVHILNDDTAQEYYVTPSTQGMAEIKQHIQENLNLANEMMYNLTNAAANSSGEALRIRISSKMQDLVGLIKNVGRGITLSLEHIDKILNLGINKDGIEYIPFTNFINLQDILNDTDSEQGDNDGKSEVQDVTTITDKVEGIEE